jgi:hypothetical protein
MRRRTVPAAASLVAAVVAAVLAAAVVLLGASSAQAHNGLRSTTPSDGEQVASPPTEVTLTFDQPAIAVGTAVLVTAADGTVVSQGDPVLLDAAVTQAVDGLTAGTYEVVWRATSADGHPVTGEFAFGVAAGAAPGTEATRTPTASDAPVTAEEETTGPTSAASGAAAPDAAPPTGAAGTSGTSGTGVLVVLGVLVAALVVGGAVVASRRRSPHGPPGQD